MKVNNKRLLIKNLSVEKLETPNFSKFHLTRWLHHPIYAMFAHYFNITFREKFQ